MECFQLNNRLKSSVILSLSKDDGLSLQYLPEIQMENTADHRSHQFWPGA
jgi:hypothetical protein